MRMHIFTNYTEVVKNQVVLNDETEFWRLAL